MRQPADLRAGTVLHHEHVRDVDGGVDCAGADGHQVHGPHRCRSRSTNEDTFAAWFFCWTLLSAKCSARILHFSTRLCPTARLPSERSARLESWRCASTPARRWTGTPGGRWIRSPCRGPRHQPSYLTFAVARSNFESSVLTYVSTPSLGRDQSSAAGSILHEVQLLPRRPHRHDDGLRGPAELSKSDTRLPLLWIRMEK